MSTSHTPAGRRLRRFLAMCALAFTAAALPGRALAATARVTWLPRGSGTIVGYSVYVRNAGSPYGSSPLWTGNPTPAADGSMSATVTFTPAASGVNDFAVVSRDATTESALSSELSIGPPNPCRHDSCVTKTSCDFTSFPDGTSCDDALFCNGSEVCSGGACRAGTPRSCDDGIACTVDTCDESAARCTHTGPQGCCLACDSADPCLADACTQGDCAAAGGVEINVNRLKLMNKATGIRLAAKGSFEGDPNLDVTATGAVFELRTVDGAVLYTSGVEGNLVKAGATGGRYRYAASRADAANQSNGITRLDLRLKGSTWLVSVKADTPLLMDAFQEPALTWMLQFGNGGCARKMGMDCTQKPSISICR